MSEYKAVSRASRLAQIQVQEVFSALPEISYEMILLESYGDRHQNISLVDNPDPDFFTRELDEFILAGKADLAVHSAKDLPFPLPAGLKIAALTQPFDQRDALAASCSLFELPPGSRIGTSSRKRMEEIVKLRPDCQAKDIRGTIEDRLSKMDRGEYDAVIVAACALKRLNLEHRIREYLPFETHPLQGLLAVVIRDDRPDLEVLFSKIDHRKTYGKVWIAGAGIGDPTWLSCQTAGLLKTADITIYDDLIHPEIIRKIRGDKIYAGKRAEGEHTPQQTINEILYREALKGKTVLRLKGGDPLIFGRGGEEALYLRERMVPVALIPGVTSAQAAASVLELPLTHRNLSRSLAFLSGQYEDPSLFVSNEADTLVYYMGGGRLDVIGEYLNRVRPGIPSVIVSKLGYPDERIYKTDSESMKTLQAGKPALIINGKTTDLMRVRDKVLYTGLDPSRCNLDARIIHYPLIETVSPDSIRLPDENYQGIIFTSKETISFFIRAGLPVKGRIIAIGPSTRRALKEAGIETDHIPEEYSADGIHQLISRLSGMKYLYPCSSLSGNILHHHPDILPLTVYETRYVEQTPLDLSSFRGVFFTSPSTVQGYLRIYGKLPEDKILYVMGKTTGKALIDSKAESRWIIYQGGSHV